MRLVVDTRKFGAFVSALCVGKDGKGRGVVVAHFFMCASRPRRANGSISLSIPGPSYGTTGVPPGLPVVVLGDGSGSYCRLRSQYCVYEP